MHTVRLLLLAVVCGMVLGACSRGPQGDPEDAEPARLLVQRLDAELARLRTLFELRAELQQAQEQLASSQRELAEDYPQISAAGSLEAARLPPSAQGRVRTFRAQVAEYDRLVARHNQLARALQRYLDGRSPEDVRRVVQAMQTLRERVAEMLEQANYTRAVYMARHSELVHDLSLDEALQR